MNTSDTYKCQSFQDAVAVMDELAGRNIGSTFSEISADGSYIVHVVRAQDEEDAE